MSEYHLIPEFWFDGWRRFVNGVYAHGVNNLQPFFPLDLKVHLYDQNSWQEEATKRLFRTAFKEFSPDRLKGCSVEYTWGYSLGMAEGELLDDDAEAIDRHFPTTYLGQKLQAVDESTAEKATQAVEKYIDGFKGKQRIEFNQGKLDGLKSTQEQGEEPTYESDRTNSYMLMLIMEEQLKFLDS